MKTAVIHLEIKADKLKDFTLLWNQIISEAKKEKGFINGLLLTQTEASKCLALGFWDSYENAKAFGSKEIYQKFLTSAKDLLISAPRREFYDILGDVSGLLPLKKVA